MYGWMLALVPEEPVDAIEVLTVIPVVEEAVGTVKLGLGVVSWTEAELGEAATYIDAGTL